MDFPEEIYAEILSYIRALAHHPRSLQGLQVGLTCRDLYKQFYPAIASYQLNALAEAFASRRLTIHVLHPSKARSTTSDKEFLVGKETELLQERVEALFLPSLPNNGQGQHGDGHANGLPLPGELDVNDPFPFDFQVTYFCAPSDDAEGEMWSIHSWLSREWALPRLRRIRLYLRESLSTASPGRGWKAQLKLLQLSLERKGVEVEILAAGDPSLLSDDVNSITLNSLYFTSDGSSPIFMHEHTTPPVASLSTPFKRLNVNAAGLMKKLGSQADRHRNQPLSSVELAELLSSEARSSTRAKPHAIWDEGVKTSTRLRAPDTLAALNSLAENSKVQMSSLCLRGRVFHLHPLWFHSIHSPLSGSAASLTHLHLDRLGLEYHDWAAILPSWTFPALEFFKVEYVQVPFPVLMAFLQRHPTIVSATLLIFTIVGSLKTSNFPSLDYLPRLKQLVATPPLLLTLFKQRLRVGPNIDGLNISREHRHPPPPDVGTFDDITQVLWQISPSIWPSLCTLSLVLPCVPGLDEWLSRSLNSNPSHVDRSEIHILFLRLFRRYGSDKGPDRKLKALDKITTLNLFFPEQRNNLNFRLDGNTLITAAFGLIAAFPALEDVYMRGSLDQFLPEAAHDFFPQLGDLVQERWKSCGNLERLEIHHSGLTGSGCEFDSIVRERPLWLPKKSM